MNKTFHTRMNILIWIFSLIIAVLLTLVAFIIFNVDFVRSKFGEVDLVAFIGSIIGGFITIIGVVATIQYSIKSVNLVTEKQDREKYIDQYPIKSKLLDKKIKEITKFQQNIKFDDHHKLNESITLLYTLVQETEVISGRVYHYIKGFVDYIENIVNIANRTVFYNLTDQDERESKLIEIEKKINEKFYEVVAQLKLEKDNMKNKFVKYLKDDE